MALVGNISTKTILKNSNALCVNSTSSIKTKGNEFENGTFIINVV